MYLKKLSIQGFKSFASRTTFDFTTGVTAIVGPNGSGKSNVADALRWVLGEQSNRLLRAKKQEDVIFAGANGRSAVGMAEVILTLDNADKWLPLDFSEVEVGRRVYRNGDSEYLLNGSRVRLRDVVDILMKGEVGQNSYSIMGQGLVDEVLSMNPEERRSFLDEAADVKRFRAKIREAQDRLAATRDNIGRVSLIVAEIEPRLAQLGRQAERAAEHRRLSAELADLLRTYYGHRWSEAQNHLVRARASLDQRIAEGATASERVIQVREQLRTLSEEIRKRREAIVRRDTRNAEIDGRLAGTEQAIALDRERHAMVTARHEELRIEVEQLEMEQRSLSTTDLDEGRRGLEVAEEIAGAKEQMQRFRAALEAAERDYAAVRSRAQELRDGADGDERRAGGLQADSVAAERRLTELEREEIQVAGRRRQLIGELKAYALRYLDLGGKLHEAEDQLDAARGAAEAARERLTRMQEEVRRYETAGHADLRELDHLEGRLDALKRVQAEHDGVAAGTRSALIMGQALIDGVAPGSLGEPPEVNGVLGLLARQLRVPAGLELAVNAALESRLHAVVVEHESAALQAIDLLLRRRAGRAQFLSLESVRHVYPLNLQKEKGVVGVAAKLVRCEQRFRPLIDTLLGRVIIVEDVQTGLRMVRRALGAVVTLDGTYIEPTGVLTGGSSGAEEGVFSRHRELEELPERIEELRGRTRVSAHQIEQAREAIEVIAVKSRESEQAYEALRRRLDGGRHELERERDRLHRLRREMDGVRARQGKIGTERATAQRVIGQAQEATQHLQQRRDERRTMLVALEEDLREATARRESTLKDVSEASSRVASVEGERKALQSLRDQHEKALQRLAGQVSAKQLQLRNFELEGSVITERMAKMARELEAIRGEATRFTEDAAPDRDELHRFEAHERAVQQDLADAQAALLAGDRARLDLEAEVARAEDQIEVLRQEMEREGLAPNRSGAIVPIDEAIEEAADTAAPSAVVQGGADIDAAKARARIEEIRRQIRRLGPINAEAPQDFQESKERHDFLTAQLRDLSDAEAQLREAIEELNVEIRVRFDATFEKVNASFGEYFSAFFGGGQAKLILVGTEQVADAGIEIEAQPPGKKIKSLSLLSGGERSLTAVALLFALLTANPAPFCVLDEVDAALDEANVGRFTGALRSLAERTQFLMVTHNRRSIEVADAIYGVSMGRDGVSKVLSLRLGDIEKD